MRTQLIILFGRLQFLHMGLGGSLCSPCYAGTRKPHGSTLGTTVQRSFSEWFYAYLYGDSSWRRTGDLDLSRRFGGRPRHTRLPPAGVMGVISTSHTPYCPSSLSYTASLAARTLCKMNEGRRFKLGSSLRSRKGAGQCRTAGPQDDQKVNSELGVHPVGGGVLKYK